MTRSVGHVYVWAVILLGFSAVLAPGRSYAQRMSAATLQQGPIDLSRGPKYSEGRILVRFRPGTSAAAMKAAHQTLGSTVMSEPAIVDRLHVVQLAQGMSVPQAIRQYRNNVSVLYAEPDYIVQASNVPNDPLFPTQWNLLNTGQNGGVSGADIHATQAWDISTGSSSLVVAVLDTGIDYNHSDLAANVWSAPNAFTATGLNGVSIQCAAGVHGLNALDSSCDPFDDNSHGTHVSGIIGAVGNNSLGVAGVNWTVQILPCKFIDSQGFGDISHALVCLSFIKQMKDSGINIVVSNNSWGGLGISQSLQDAVAAQMQDGILFVAAAGNDFSDNDLFPTYPANIFLPNVISVAASTRTDDIVTFSNVGRHTVHLSAPGHEILSTTPFNTYSVFSGTSMAAPHVAGVAALLKAQDPTRDWRAIKNLILAGGDSLPAMAETITQKRLNVFGAMTCNNASVQARLLPIPATISGSVGSPIVLSMLNINCAQPAGNVAVTVTPGNQTINLSDDGTGNDQAAGDGIYTGQFIPSGLGSYSLQFPDGSTVKVEVLSAYGFAKIPFTYQTITGTSLDLGDDSVAQISSPFPIQFGGASFTQLYVSSNGTISFTDPFVDFVPRFLTPGGFPSFTQEPTTLVAPWWEDLYPLKGTAQNVFFQVVGSAPTRQLVVEWRNVPSFQCRSDATANITFEAVFNEASNDVQFNYNDASFGGDCAIQDFGQGATIGIQPSPTTGAMWGAIESDATGTGTSVRWQSPPPALPPNAVPVIGDMLPSSAPLFSPNLNLTVNGGNFVFGSLVQWNGINVPTTFVNSTQLTAVLPAIFFVFLSPFDFGGTATVTVFNPSPGGGTSAGLTFTISNISGAPSIASISPNSTAAGGFSFPLTVKGNNLFNTTIFWGSTALTTSPVNNNETVALVSSALISSPGTVQITAIGSGGSSNAVPFTVSPATTMSTPPASLPVPGQISVDSSGKLTSKSPNWQKMRFLGWNYGRTIGGPAYLQRYSRPYGGASAMPPPAQPSAATIRSTASAVSLGVPSSLPGFAFHPTLPAGNLPTSIATGDFNKDGKMDWVVSNGGSNNLWLYLGNGDGTAQLPIIIPCTGAAPIQVVAADLRKIGVLDLVVAEVDSQTIGVLLGNGDGTFAPEVTYFVPRPPLSVAVGDFNGDGKLDIVVGLLGDEFSGPLATFLGDGTGTFGPPITYLDDNTNLGSFATVQVIAADLNGDGVSDLVTFDEGGIEEFNGAHAYMSRGDGTFKDGGVINGGSAVALGDMDGDGCLDAVTVAPIGLVGINKGLCDGTFTQIGAYTIGAGEQPVSVALADMDGDGHLDVVTAGANFGSGGPFGQEATNLVTVLPGDGHGTLGVARVYRSEPSMFGLALADLNGDGRPDVILASQDTDTASVFINDGHGNLAGPSGEYIGYQDGANFGTVNAPGTNDFFVLDLNGDGKPDLAVVELPQFFGSPWDLAVMLNDGTGHFAPAVRFPMADSADTPFGYVFGNFRNTGLPDLLTYEFDPVTESNPAIVLTPNIGNGKFGPPVTTALNPNVVSEFGILAAGDFNGDGKLDFVIAGVKPSGGGALQATVFLGNGNGTFQQGTTQVFATAANLGTNARSIYAGDFNHDGKLDLLIWTYDQVIGNLNHNIYELLGNGDGTFQPAKLVLANTGFFTVADLNHDGLPDIVEYVEPLTTNAALLPYGFNIYLGQSDGSFQLTNTYQPYPGLFDFAYLFDNGSPQQRLSPMVADFNGDGNLDLAAFQFQSTFPATASYLQILAGNGDGTFTPTYAITRFDKALVPQTAADVTGDGRADLIELDGLPSSFHVIPSVPGPALQLSLPVSPVIGTNGTLVVNQSLLSVTPSSISLSASDPNITIQSTVTIPAGNLSATVPFTIGPNFNSSRAFSLTAQLGSQTAVVYSYHPSTAFAGFHLFSTFSKQTVPPGGAGFPNTVGVVSYGGYTTTAQLSCQGLPAGVSCLFGQPSVNVQPGINGGASLILQVGANVPLGAYVFQVVASDGGVTDALPLRLIVADFSLSFTPASVTVVKGKTANFTLVVGSIGQWTDPVNMSCQTSPPAFCPLGSPITFPGTYPAVIPTDQITPGDYTYTISASADGVTHQSLPAILHVQGVSGTISANAATIPVGSSANFNLSLNSQNGLTDTFTFSCPGLPSGMTCGFNPASGTLPANGTLNTVLTISVTSRPAAALPLDNNKMQPPRWLFAVIVTFAILLFRATWPFAAGKRYRRALAGALCGLVVLALLSSAGCGSGGPPPPPPPPPPTPTPTPTPAPTKTVIVTVQATSNSVTSNLGFITVTIP